MAAKKTNNEKTVGFKVGDRIRIIHGGETGVIVAKSTRQVGHFIVEKDGNLEEIDHIQAVPPESMALFDTKNEFEEAKADGIEYGNNLPENLWHDVEDLKQEKSDNYMDGWLTGIAIGLEKMAKRFPKTLADYEKFEE